MNQIELHILLRNYERQLWRAINDTKKYIEEGKKTDSFIPLNVLHLKIQEDADTLLKHCHSDVSEI